MVHRSDKTNLAADVRGDLMQFSLGAPTINREDILDLCDQWDALRAENKALAQDRDVMHGEMLILRAEVERLKQLHDHDEEALFCGCCACNLRGSKTENERLIVELTHRVGWEERCLRAEAALEQISGYPHVSAQIARATLAQRYAT